LKTALLILLVALSSYSKAADLRSSRTLSSAILSENREITVYLPDTYQSEKSKHYPVLFILDGEINGDLAAGMFRRMAVSEGSNEHIVIAIHSTDRLRDYAPTINNDPRGPVGKGGGGDKFLDFLETELIPDVNKQFRTLNQRVLAGHSIAGLLVLHSFHTRPNLFQAHLAFSPAVWWGERETLKATQKYVLSNKDINSYLYMNIGSEGGEMRVVYDSLAQTISKNRTLGLSLRTDEFDYEGHGLTLAAGLYNAFKGLYKYQQSKGI
jgi:predicted alpha/beta superfamily hydrolase